MWGADGGLDKVDETVGPGSWGATIRLGGGADAWGSNPDADKMAEVEVAGFTTPSVDTTS